MDCPVCGVANLKRSTRGLPYTYKGESTVIPKVKGYFCKQCGEATLDGVQAETVSAAMLAFNKEVNGNLLDPKFIVKIRRKLELDQRQAAEIFGGGVNAFSRYENGKTKPPLALIKLLLLLDHHPELLKEVKAF